MRRRSVSISNSTTSIMQEFGVSCLAASLAHIPHHPLYTLKSQMMFYGREFSFFTFARRTRVTKGTFLFQGRTPKCVVNLILILPSPPLPHRFSPQDIWHCSGESPQDASMGAGWTLGGSPRGQPNHHQVDDGRSCCWSSHHYDW